MEYSYLFLSPSTFQLTLPVYCLIWGPLVYIFERSQRPRMYIIQSKCWCFAALFATVFLLFFKENSQTKNVEPFPSVVHFTLWCWNSFIELVGSHLQRRSQNNHIFDWIWPENQRTLSMKWQTDECECWKLLRWCWWWGTSITSCAPATTNHLKYTEVFRLESWVNFPFNGNLLKTNSLLSRRRLAINLVSPRWHFRHTPSRVLLRWDTNTRLFSVTRRIGFEEILFNWINLK